jgi:anti-anti-sigma factor
MERLVYRPLGSPDAVLVELEVDVRGRLSEEFRMLVHHLSGQGVKWMIMDCSKLRSMDSLAMGVLLMAFRLCEHKGGAALLLCPSPDLVTLLEAMNIDKFFQVFADSDSILAFLEEQGVRISSATEQHGN